MLFAALSAGVLMLLALAFQAHAARQRQGRLLSVQERWAEQIAR